MKRTRTALAVATGTALALAMAAPAVAADPVGHSPSGVGHEVRFATFNASLNRSTEGELVEDLSSGDDEQARNVAETIQRAHPDVVLVNEFDYSTEAVDLFRENYLEVSQRGADPAEYPYSYVAPSNTGIPSDHDLDDDGEVGGPGDALGFGDFPGQYGMVVYSKYPIDTKHVRTFQHFLWQDMPGNLIPRDYYTDAELADLRLSSKSHWDVPIDLGNKTVHFLVSHPTPPVFDGPEDRNGRRNSDEIRFWSDYIIGGQSAEYIYDDEGVNGGLPRGARFVVAGDQNADPHDGDSFDGAIRQLLDNPRLHDTPVPSSKGGVEASKEQGGANDEHVGDPAHDTADFAEPPGNVRVDYVLPSRNLRVTDSGVFWPAADDPRSRLTASYPFPTSDHRLVWIDAKVGGAHH